MVLQSAGWTAFLMVTRLLLPSVTRYWNMCLPFINIFSETNVQLCASLWAGYLTECKIGRIYFSLWFQRVEWIMEAKSSWASSFHPMVAYKVEKGLCLTFDFSSFISLLSGFLYSFLVPVEWCDWHLQRRSSVFNALPDIDPGAPQSTRWIKNPLK